MIQEIPIYMAFAAGLISFISPCVLPLVPGYISFISGVPHEPINAKTSAGISFEPDKIMLMMSSLFFVAGFSVIFILLGASATWIGGYLSSRISLFMKLAGLIIIFFGVFKMGLIRWIFLYRDIQFHLKDRKVKLPGAFLIGASFAFGWTPCIGPILGGILVYAGTLGSVNQGIMLLSIYSLGLGIPFILTAVAMNRFQGFFNRIKRHLGLIEKISGLIMIILGILIFSNKLILIPGYLTFMNRFAL